MNLWKVIKILQTESSDMEVFDEELQEDELSGSDEHAVWYWWQITVLL